MENFLSTLIVTVKASNDSFLLPELFDEVLKQLVIDATDFIQTDCAEEVLLEFPNLSNLIPDNFNGVLDNMMGKEIEVTETLINLFKPLDQNLLMKRGHKKS